jgi:hypothetical protein
MPIVETMARMSPTYLRGARDVSFGPACPQGGDILVWKHLDVIPEEPSAPTVERPPVPAMGENERVTRVSKGPRKQKKRESRSQADAR